ncbi:MAG: cyclic nucleotide-binding domain-containing protein [Rhizobiales bacterium]|nr:cyclic nucleotide-binding domain-containing protein [Hyphomicrobiales bacterium]
MHESSGYFGLIVGNLTYIVVGISWLLTNIMWLRIVAVIGLCLEITYMSQQPGGPVWTTMGWDTVFITINLVQLAILVRDRLSLKLTKEERVYLAPVLERLDKAQIARMLRTGGWKTLEPGTMITREGDPVSDLTLICAGRAEVKVHDAILAHVGPGVFIGEIAFTTGRPATASVMVTETVRILALDQAKLRQLCKQDQQIASAIYALIGGGLADKMHASNERMQPSPAGAGEATGPG